MAKSNTQEKSIEDYKKLNTLKEVVVHSKDLPLHCPTDESAIWCAHPRVFLAIEDATNSEIRCPYCGTLYRLED